MVNNQAMNNGEPKPENISVFGLGYVGTVSACCLAAAGHHVIGVDVVSEKVAAINHGGTTLVEPGLEELAKKVVADGHLCATESAEAAVRQTDISMIAVGTPSAPNGMPDLSQLYGVCTAIGKAISQKTGGHDCVIRSTVLPGTTERCARLLENASGKREGDGFRLLVNPEFLREGMAIHDYYAPPFIVIGAEAEGDAQRLARVYAELHAPLFLMPRREAEIIKYACNAFHAVKVVFANEIGRICRAACVDSRAVLEVFCRDHNLNLSPYYLKPGFAYGGSCLPKDLRAILSYARKLRTRTPMLEHVPESNREQIELGCDLIEAQEKRRVALFGISFKPTTDDLRESPLIILAQRLLEKGYELRIFDRSVVLSRLHGTNRGFLETHLPRADWLITDNLNDVLPWAECLVLGAGIAEVDEVLMRATSDQTIVDLAGVGQPLMTSATYHALSVPSPTRTEDPTNPHACRSLTTS